MHGIVGILATTLLLIQGQAALAESQHHLPLMPPASHSHLQGLVRIINHSHHAGEVHIHAIDDGGQRLGPVSLRLDTEQTAHFNSTDLELGNPSKGLSGGVGDGTGNWRLELTTDLDIEPPTHRFHTASYAYLRERCHHVVVDVDSAEVLAATIDLSVS